MIKKHHTFTIDYFSEEDQTTYYGVFTSKRLSIMDQTRIAVRKSQLSNGFYCFPAGTMVSGEDVLPIEEVVVGDSVFSHDGKLHKVTELYSREYKGKLLNITIKGTLPVKCTPDHQFLVIEGYFSENGKYLPPSKHTGQRSIDWYERDPVWKKACEIKKGDFVLSPKMITEKDELANPEFMFKPKRKPSHLSLDIIDRLEPTEELEWLLGFFIADGHTSATGKQIGYTLSLKDDRDRIFRGMESMGLHPKMYFKDTSLQIIQTCASVSKSFREWFGGSSHEKKIPYFMYHGWNLKNVLEGVAAGDGWSHEDSGLRKISTVSLSLALQLFQILQSDGEFPYLYAPKRYEGGSAYPNARQLYEVFWTENPSKTQNKHIKDNYAMSVTDITEVDYDGLVYNIEVEDTHSYLVNNVVVHNCVKDEDGKPTGQGIPEEVESVNHMLSYLEVAIVQKPDWFKLDLITDQNVLFKIWEEVLDGERTFRGLTKEGTNASGTSEASSNSKPSEAKSTNNVKKVVGKEVSEALEL